MADKEQKIIQYKLNIIDKSNEENAEIRLCDILFNMKLLRRLYAPVVLLTFMIGLIIPFIPKYLNAPRYKSTALIVLDYDVENIETEGSKEEKTYSRVVDLTAPDGEPLDLGEITSTKVLVPAIEKAGLKDRVPYDGLKASISIEKVFTDETKQREDLIAHMYADKNSSQYYEQLKNYEKKYTNKLIITIDNKIENREKEEYLSQEELECLLNCVLESYNETMRKKYTRIKLPQNELGYIEIEKYETLDLLEIIKKALDNLYKYCEKLPEDAKNFRSYKTGKTITDCMNEIQLMKTIYVDDVYTYINANVVVKDRPKLLEEYTYKKGELQSKIDKLQQEIDASNSMIESYRNDSVIVSVDKNGNGKNATQTTDYYNEMIMAQLDRIEQITELNIEMGLLNDKMERIENLPPRSKEEEAELFAEAEKQFQSAYDYYNNIYDDVEAVAKELIDSPATNGFMYYTNATTKGVESLTKFTKNVIIWSLGGIVTGLAIWFVAAFVQSIKTNKKY